MPDDQDRVSRRRVLRGTGLAAGGLAVSTASFAEQAAASQHGCGGCLEICWMDVKPNSCPNAVNPKSNGTLPVTAGWSFFDPTTVALVPVKAEYVSAFDDCQDWSDPEFNDDDATATELCQLAMDSDRSASPTWWRTVDVDGDGDLDTKFKFDVADLDLEPDDTHLVLRGESTTNDCTFYAIDSVQVVDGGNNGKSRGGR